MTSKITIDGVEYMPVPDCPEKNITADYVLVRARDAGVFMGRLKSKVGQEVVLANARRLWYWDGAASVSQLAMEGVSKPDTCKFPCEVVEETINAVIETIPMTDVAVASIKAVPVWSA